MNTTTSKKNINRKLFDRIPYEVRYEENPFLPIETVEEAIESFLYEYDLTYAKIARVFNNNKDNPYYLHLELRNCDIPTNNFWFIEDNSNLPVIELSFEEFKATTRQIDSYILEEILKEQNKMDLRQAFKAMVGCNNGEIFNALDEKSFDYNNPESRFAIYRQTIIDNESFIWELSHKYNLDPMPLFKSLKFDMRKNSGNLIKATCEKLGLTYAQLADEIGYGESAISNASRGEVSKPMQKAIELYLQTLEQKKELEKLETLKSTLKSILN